MRSDDAPVSRGKAKPCRKCGETHWHVYEKTPNVWAARVWFRGRRVVRTIGSHKLALEAAAKWKEDVRRGEFALGTIKHTDELLTDAIQAYIARRQEGDFQGTDWPRIGRVWLNSPQLKGKGVRDLAPDDGEDHLKRVVGRRAAANKHVCFLHTFFEVYEDRRRRDPKRRGQLPVPNPMRGLRKSEEGAVRKRWLEDNEEQRLLAALPSDPARAIVLLAIHTGLRKGNLLALKWSDVNLTDRTVRQWSRKGRRKRLKERWQPLNRTAVEAVRALASRGRSEWLFPNERNSGPLDARNWNHRVWYPALKKARIRDLHFHDLRHELGTRLRAKGLPTDLIGEALFHADSRLAERVYAHVKPGHMARVLALLDEENDTSTATPTATAAGTGVTRHEEVEAPAGEKRVHSLGFPPRLEKEWA